MFADLTYSRSNHLRNQGRCRAAVRTCWLLYFISLSNETEDGQNTEVTETLAVSQVRRASHAPLDVKPSSRRPGRSGRVPCARSALLGWIRHTRMVSVPAQSKNKGWQCFFCCLLWTSIGNLSLSLSQYVSTTHMSGCDAYIMHTHYR